MSRSIENKYVSRAGDKLASVSDSLKLQFSSAVMLDVGSSTGGFTDYALQNGAKEVFAVDSGTDQLHKKLRGDARIHLYEKTDIRDFVKKSDLPQFTHIVIDVSFISLKAIIPTLMRVAGKNTLIIAMVKPQFEAKPTQKYKGIVKNDTIRRQILKDFEVWIKTYCLIEGKSDSDVAGLKGNKERFYRLRRVY